MSSRAFRRLHGDADIIKLPAVNVEYIDSDEELNPTLQQQKRKTETVNPFELVSVIMSEIKSVLAYEKETVYSC